MIYNKEKNHSRYIERINKGLCGHCKEPTDGYAYCQKCRKICRESQNNQVKERLKAGLCTRCKIKNDSHSKYYCNKCLKHANQIRRKNYFKLRLEVISHYSNKTMICACCSENNIKFLTIDHINNDGSLQRRKIKDETGKSILMYRYLKNKSFPSGFQVLCFNCNCGKSTNGGKCPYDD